ncbi:helix-turn-helix domain-containing protein [Dyella sp. KRB-257]|uniref:helix-turn-helix domain-containing protein n=1 Tax=Dyella sp. KRB-257 TaxID=3400915 RepID=UPI003C0446CC
MTQQTSLHGQDSREQEHLAVPAPVDLTVSPAPPATGPSFGSRLRAAREAQGLDLEGCGHALKLPARLLRQLEGGHYDGIDYQVYLASYITKYGRHLGLDDALIQAEVSRIRRREEPQLVATGGISHSRYLLERYATAATYLVLTAVIIVPVVWLGVRGTLDRDISHFAPLDASPVAQQESPVNTSLAASANLASSRPGALHPVPSHTDDDQPLLASMVPNMSIDPVKPAAVPAPMIAVDGGMDGGHTLSLSLAQASWVEVIAADGSRLEYSLLPAGSRKTYHSDQALEVRLGNASGAKVSIDGEDLPLDAYRRANVAHFRLDLQDGKVVPRSV